MSKWTDPNAWAKLCSGETCPICLAGDRSGGLAELEVSSVGFGPTAPMRGYCCLVFRRHVVELHDLTADEAAAYMRDIQRLSPALKLVTGAVKMNYEIHGNTIPHLHTHFFPRYVGDRFEGDPIDPRVVSEQVYAAGEFEELGRRLREALTAEPNEALQLNAER